MRLAGGKMLGAGVQMPGAKGQMQRGMDEGILCRVTKTLRVCDDKQLNLWEDSGYIESASVAHGELPSHRASVRIAVRAQPKGPRNLHDSVALCISANPDSPSRPDAFPTRPHAQAIRGPQPACKGP